jgi:Holliday junction resolvase RusA-like endonuclease
MSRGWAFVALGTPAPQGSHRAFVVKTKTGANRAVVTQDSARTKPWRAAIKEAAPPGPQLEGPVAMSIVFTLARPKSAKKTLTIPATRPDLDKYLRSTLDAVTEAGLLHDDAQVAEIVRLAKVWSPAKHGLSVPGALIAGVEMNGEWEASLSRLANQAFFDHLGKWERSLA